MAVSRDYLLDTNIIIELLHQNLSVVRKIVDVGINHCLISVITLHELYFGAYNAPKEQYKEEELTRISL